MFLKNTLPGIHPRPCEVFYGRGTLPLVIEKSISDKLEQFIADTKLSKTATVEKALEEYIEKYNKTGKI